MSKVAQLRQHPLPVVVETDKKVSSFTPVSNSPSLNSLARGLQDNRLAGAQRLELARSLASTYGNSRMQGFVKTFKSNRTGLIQRCGCATKQLAEDKLNKATTPCKCGQSQGEVHKESIDLQRTTGDGHDLTSPRFSDMEKLQACFDDQDRLRTGDTGEPVVRVQQALKDLDYDLGPKGVDGFYGPKTAKAVTKFKQDHNLQPTIGDVGPKTIGLLDQICPGEGPCANPGPSPTPGPGPAPDPGQVIIGVANKERLSALPKVLAAITELQQAQPGVPDENDLVVKAFHRWMLTRPDSNFWPTVERAKQAIQKNLGIAGTPFLIDRSCNDFAHVDGSGDPVKGITFCQPFFDSDASCQREVITHEFFHFVVGLQHHYDASTTEEALNCPHHLAELVFDIATGEVGGCGNGATCF